MAKVVVFAVLVIFNTFLSVILAGTVAVQHRDTTLDELKSIDSYVSSASLPILQDGFFIGTSRGPVLVKSSSLPGANSRPMVRSKYYNTLPRLIPAGFEGIAVSHFNLGAANPYRPLSPSKNLVAVPAGTQPLQYADTPASPAPEQYVAQPSGALTQQAYQPQRFIAEAQQPQEFISQPQQPYIQNDQAHQFIQNDQPPQQSFIENDQQLQPHFIQNDQLQQQFIHNEHPLQQLIQNEQSQQQFNQNDHPPQQQFTQNEHPPQQQFTQNEHPPQQQFNQNDPPPQQHQFQQNEQPQQYPQSEPSQQQYLQAEQPQHQFIRPEQHQFSHPEQSQPQQQPFQYPQQYAYSPSQLISDHSVDSQHAAQEQAQISSRSQSSSPVAEPSFQVDNLLRPEQEPSVTAFQTQVFGPERFQSQKLLRNSAVVATTDFEETLPETLRNRFYKNANLATILAQESLPIQGEQIITEWDTNKIAKGKIHALLRGAGLI